MVGNKAGVQVHTCVIATILCAASNVALAQPSAEGRQDVWAIAPSTTAISSLGQLHTAAFEPVIGTAGQLVVPPGSVVVQRRQTTDHEWRVLASADELHANARVWGVGAASQSHTHHAIYRAYTVEEIHQLPSSFTPHEVQHGAEWYVSAISVGRLVEYHFASSTRSLEATFALPIPSGTSIGAFQTRHNMTARLQMRAVSQTPGEPTINPNFGALTQFHPSGDPEPILIRYSRVPRSARLAGDPQRRRRLQLLTVRFPERKPNNTPWDALGGFPDITVRIRQSGSVLAVVNAPDGYLATFNREFDVAAVTPQAPLVFEFSDRDVSNHDSAGQLVLDELPSNETAHFRPPTNDFGVRIDLAVGP